MSRLPVLLALLLPGCASAPDEAQVPWGLFIFAAFVSGIALTLVLVRLSERCRCAGCDPEAPGDGL